MKIDRAFVRIKEGLVHYRVKESDTAVLPLYMVHAGPVSSASLIPLIEALSPTRTIYAPDTLGFGDSVAPSPETPDLTYYADSVVRILDALGLEKVDYYGSHTGAHIGCELAITHPDRVGHLIFEGIGLFDEKTKGELLDNYAPAKRPDEFGSQFQWAWQFMRDQSLFFPYFKRDTEHRLNNPVFPTDMLHDAVVDVLKALTSYHKGYNAVFRHETNTRLPLVKQKIMFMAVSWDPMKMYLDKAMDLQPSAHKVLLDASEGVARQAQLIEGFLDG